MANGLNKQVSLNVDTLSKIPSLENALKSGRINIILVFAEWCGACHKFRKNIWDPMLQKNAMHNRIAVRDDVLRKTSLRGANFDYLPSILVVDEKGVAQVFNTPEGKTTNATPTPKNLTDMLKMVNIPVKPLTRVTAANAPVAAAAAAANAPADPTALMEEISANIRKNNALNTMNRTPNINLNMENIEENNTLLNESPLNESPLNESPLNESPLNESSLNESPLNESPLNESPLNTSPLNTSPKKQSAIPEGTVFMPTPLVAPQRGGQQGGSLLSALQSTAQGVVPASVLGSLVFALRGGRRRKTKRAPARGKVDRRTRRHK
jgi:thiol-disulfide isomerase/thioredoxin